MRYAERSSERGRSTGSPSRWSRTSSPAARTSSARLSQIVQPGLRRQLEQVVALPQRAEHPAHLGERRTAGLLDVLQRLLLLGPGRHPVPDRPDLEHHHAHRVGDHVVELPRHPRPLLGHRHPGRRLPLPLGPQRPVLRHLAPLGPGAQGEPHEPGHAEEGGAEDQVVDPLGRVVATTVAAEIRTTASPTRAWSPRPQPTQQHGRAHPAQVDPGLGRDQLVVEEAQRPRCRSRRTPAPGTATACAPAAAAGRSLIATTSNHSCTPSGRSASSAARVPTAPPPRR